MICGQEGKEEKARQRQIALKMLSAGFSVQEIARFTDLSKKSGLKPRLLRRKVFGAGNLNPRYKNTRPPPAFCLLPSLSPLTIEELQKQNERDVR
jgi:hypothetical protein